ncbi:Gfo/Idh/MocA family protein [Amycolatopsis granulosa]|uniref:Gfo/Idh/MocA family protein n=1 Tax=Amycolatopsis granulosa TaxID=185684 RepID=UPI0014243074|nr:putative dehydrogenase [Amycolatopsis granulosa]
MTDTLGIACLGVTHPHASGRVRKMIGTPGVRVVGAADDADVIEPFTRLLNIPRRSADELLADPGVHAVLIHSKSKDMTPLAVRAMRAGKAVLVEKPGGASVSDLKELTEVAEETGSVCQVGFTYRFSPAITAASEILRAGALGDVLQVRAHGACSLDEAATSHINLPDDMGGAFWVIGSHIVDLVLSQFGVPVSVNGRVSKLPGDQRSAYREDAAVAILNYPDRSVSIDFFSWDSMPWVESWVIEAHGTGGSLYTRPLPVGFDLFLANGFAGYPKGWTRWSESAFPEPWAAHTTEYSPELAEIANTEFFDIEGDAFLRAVRGEAQVVVTPRDAYNAAHVIETVYRSSAEGGAEVKV